ncbi:gas vesicle protein GvpG [uncultured Clostridium sp.]|uniref:gas vesicle protein GvpG n=1 Tax=uncultured Clostridium sp. TaxID=59620 RepID=UPI0028E56536|nr:gas vesicle protein GvpG [uncultured Clostridium sp.]
MWFFNRIIDVFEVIYREGEKEMLDEGKYKEMLNELYAKLDNGEIDEETYEKIEGELLNVLKEIREYKRENQIVD